MREVTVAWMVVTEMESSEEIWGGWGIELGFSGLLATCGK